MSSFSDEIIYSFIIKVFLLLNKREDIIIEEYKYMRVKKDNIKKLELLFDILIKNKNENIQNKICEFLVKLCLNLYDYKTSFCQQYWQNFIHKIRDSLEKEQKNNNIIGLIGLIKLIEMIYSSSVNYGGIIPQKEDFSIVEAPSNLYLFELKSYKRYEKQYRLKVGKKDKLLPMRFKLGYYYDIPVNNVVFEDINGKKFSFIDENLLFEEVFPSEIYCPKDGNKIPIKVLEEKDLFLKIEGNPKELIENDEIIFNIIISILYSDSKINDEIKQKIWDILYKFQNNIFINKIK